MKKVVLAFDSFKGCITAKEACDAAAMGVLSVCPEATVVQMPMSDGGEGLVKCVRQIKVRRTDILHCQDHMSQGRLLVQ